MNHEPISPAGETKGAESRPRGALRKLFAFFLAYPFVAITVRQSCAVIFFRRGAAPSFVPASVFVSYADVSPCVEVFREVQRNEEQMS